MQLTQFFNDRVSDGRPMVLVTVFDTIGSTYSKSGGQMLIDSDGHFCGLLSGGCLESDLVERARKVIETETASTADYELSMDDELFGLGVGCDGTMRVLLQPLLPARDFQPFAAIAELVAGDTSAGLATVVAAASDSISAGASLLLPQDGVRQSFAMSDAVAKAIEQSISTNNAIGTRHVDTPEGACSVLHMSVVPPPALLVLGAGLDAEPVVRIAAELGWRCTLYDHRPAYIESRSLPASTRAACHPVDALGSQLSLDTFDMAIVMSHHLASDRAYLRQLAATDMAYIGLLGPPGRRERLLQDLGSDVADSLRGRLRGPAGLDLGGRGPGPIALSIVAEMQQHLSEPR